MKKLLLSTMLLLCASFSLADTFTNRFGLVQISTSPGDIWGTKTNANWATIDAGVAGQSLYNVYTTTQVFSGDVVFTNISPGGYMTVDSSGNLTTQAGGGGGGSSSLATALGTTAGFSTLISTPTGAVILNKNQFVGQLVGPSTAYYDLNQNTTYYIHNGSTAQTAAMNISTATIGNVTISTLTVLSSATISNVNLTGTTLAYSSGTFLNSVAIGTTNANGQALRVIDQGTGINTYESVSNQTLYYELENNTSGTLANEYMQLLGTGGDSATGAVAGDGEIKTSGNMYLSAGGSSAKSSVEISSTTGSTAVTSVKGSPFGETIKLSLAPAGQSVNTGGITYSSQDGPGSFPNFSLTITSVPVSGFVTPLVLTFSPRSSVNGCGTGMIWGSNCFPNGGGWFLGGLGGGQVISNANTIFDFSNQNTLQSHSNIISVSTSSVSSLYIVDVSTTGHLNSQSVSGSTVTSCGTNPSITGSDIAGTISTGGGSPTACTLTFAKPFTNTPVCLCAANGVTACDPTSTSNTSVTFGIGITETSIKYICIGSD